MEKRDLYNKDKERTNETILSTQEAPENRYILVELVLIQNNQGKILVQKRSKQKDGKYGLTAGHAKTGENSIQGIVTEIKEELGVNVNANELKLMYTERNDNDRCFYDLYYLLKDYDISKMELQPKEVEAVRWCSKEEIKNLCKNGEFKQAHIEPFEIIMNKINQSF